jgi:hypothetical protein
LVDKLGLSPKSACRDNGNPVLRHGGGVGISFADHGFAGAMLTDVFNKLPTCPRHIATTEDGRGAAFGYSSVLALTFRER